MGKGSAIIYTQAELDWVKQNSHLDRRSLHTAFCGRFARQDITFDNLKALCTRNGWLNGRNGCFPQGHVPANKGMKMPYNANSARTQFKKGRPSINEKPLGHERVNIYGYVEIHIDEVNPWTGYKYRYVAKHRHLWEQLHGPIPDDHCLKCLGDDKTNTDPSNWACIPRSLLPRLNGRWTKIKYDDAPAELKSIILATAKLEYAAKKAGEI